MTKLGALIGIVRHSFNITNDGDEKTSLTINVDFTSASDIDIKNWLVSNRIIAGQRPWRKLSLAELVDLDGSTFIAQSIGQKVKSRSEQIQALVNAGLPENIAIMAIDNPSTFNTVMASINDASQPDDNASEIKLDE